MASSNVSAQAQDSTLRVQEIQRLQCRAENALASALYYVRSGASLEKIEQALGRVHRAADLLTAATSTRFH